MQRLRVCPLKNFWSKLF